MALIADLDAAARKEITLAAKEGRFDDLQQLIPLAKEIAAIVFSQKIETRSGSPEPADSLKDKLRSSVGNRSPKALKSKKTDYPQFLREKQDFVKLGWSAKEKKPYEHRVPKVSLDVALSAVASCGKTGHRFTMNDILKAVIGSKGAEPIPSYQVYAVVSWLKWAGMVLQHGRQGYNVVRPQSFISSVEAAWQSLPQR